MGRTRRRQAGCGMKKKFSLIQRNTPRESSRPFAGAAGSLLHFDLPQPANHRTSNDRTRPTVSSTGQDNQPDTFTGEYRMRGICKAKRKVSPERTTAMLPKENGHDLGAHQHQTVTNWGSREDRPETRVGPRPRPSALRHMRLTKMQVRGIRTNTNTRTTCSRKLVGRNRHVVMTTSS